MSNDLAHDWHWSATNKDNGGHPYNLSTVQWRHNEHDGVSNQQPHDCLLNSLCSANQRKHQSFVSLAFVWGIHRWPVNSPHIKLVMRKMFLFDDVIKMSSVYLSRVSVLEFKWFGVPSEKWMTKKVSHFFVRFFSTPALCFHIKTFFIDTEISIIIGTPILVRWYLYIEMASCFLLQVFTHCSLSKIANILYITLWNCILLN